MLERADQTVPLAGIPVALYRPCDTLVQIDCVDQEVTSTLSEFDGFFVFDGLTPDTYRLHLSDQALQRFEVATFQPLEFTVTADDGVFYLDPIILVAGSANNTEGTVDVDTNSNSNEPPSTVTPKNESSIATASSTPLTTTLTTTTSTPTAKSRQKAAQTPVVRT